MAKGGFRGMGGGMNMQQMMRQAQKMQQDMADLQAQLETREVESSSGGGAVKVVATGKREIKSIVIDPGVIDPGDAEMLQDLVLAAVNEALRAVEEMSQKEMGRITGGMNLGGMI